MNAVYVIWLLGRSLPELHGDADRDRAGGRQHPTQECRFVRLVGLVAYPTGRR